MEWCGEDSGCEGVNSTLTSDFFIFVCRRCNMKGSTYCGAVIVTDLKTVRIRFPDIDPISAS
jgi:hypothetical protein